MQDIIIYGVNSIQTKRTLEYIQQRGDRVIAFCDGNVDLWNHEFYGIKCITPETLSDYTARVIVTSTGISAPEVRNILSNKGIYWASIADYVWENESESYNKVYQNLFDEQSKHTFSTVLYARRKLIYDDLKSVALPFSEQYFSFFNIPTGTETYVDCGAFVGESIEQYLFACLGAEKIIAFEPSLKSYKALQARVKRLINEWALDDKQIECVMAGVGETNGMCSPEVKHSSLTAGVVIGDDSDVPLYSLDSYLSGASAINTNLENQITRKSEVNKLTELIP